MKVTFTKVLSLLGFAFFFSCKQKTFFASAANQKSLLWEISGKDLLQPSYFLGTMHLMCAEDAVLSKNVKQILKNVDRVYLEVDMDNMGELLEGVTGIQMKDDKTLADVISQDEYTRVKAFFEQQNPGLPFSILERQQPMMISSSLYELFLPCEKKNGIDLRIIDEASRLKKETKGLETMAFQSSIFDSIPYAEQAKELVKTIDSIGKYQQLIHKMIQVYKSQDIEVLHDLTTEEEAGVKSYLDVLLYNRNENWSNQFPGIAKHSTLLAVGAGHLGGEKGVINLLKQQGYSVRAIVN